MDAAVEVLGARALKQVCASGGCLAESELARRLCGRDGPGALLARALQDPRRFALVAREAAAAAAGQGQQRVAVGASEARLCREHGAGKCAGQCRQLHLCRYFVYGACRHQGTWKPCKFVHDIHSEHNLAVLREHGLESLNSEELCQLLLQNDSSLLPEVCTYYNKGNGPFGNCTFKKICIKLHICQYYLQGTCKFGSDCRRSHHFDSDCLEKLEKWGMNQILIGKLPMIYRNMYDIKNSTTSSCKEKKSTGHTPLMTNSSEDSDTICLYHIRKSCSFQDKCIRVHFHLPYRWQVFDGATWTELPNMEDIEKQYCDPFNERFIHDVFKKHVPVIDFCNMTSGSAQVRRLSTASSVTKPPHFILTTEWLWYWKDEYGVWNEYGKQDIDHDAASICSFDLEKAYQSEVSPTLTFTARKQNYELDFKAMKQKNLHYQTTRDVRRRPKFVSLKEIEKKKTSGADLSKEEATNIPAHWDQSALPELGYKLITLLSSSNEYRKVQVNFERTMPKATIKRIARIQNLALWEVYQWQKEQMKKANGGKDVDEKLLFHGTSKNHVDAICQQNFDWRICGVHGTAYGKGSYFARDASYSDNYCQYDSISKTMFLARVLVGEFTNGSSSFLRPPAKDIQNSTFYDSCVNSTNNPSIFVIFEKHQIYPEYLIEYSTGGTCSGGSSVLFPFLQATYPKPK